MPTPPILISPSVLDADLSRLSEEVERIASADLVHLDIMDNHFVPNLTFGLPVVERLLQHTSMRADVHLMIENPDTWAPAYAEAGAASVTFHAEAAAAPVKLARELRAKGARAALALRPATGIEPYLDLLPEFDMILVMTVEPGFGGQSFIEGTLPKIRRTRAAIDELGADIWIQVDGGVSRATIAGRRLPGRTCSSRDLPSTARRTRLRRSRRCAHSPRTHESRDAPRRRPATTRRRHLRTGRRAGRATSAGSDPPDPGGALVRGRLADHPGARRPRHVHRRHPGAAGAEHAPGRHACGLGPLRLPR